MLSYFLFIFKKRVNIIISLILSILFFIFLRILPQLTILIDFFKLPGISLKRHLEVIWDYAFKSIAHLPFVDTLVAFVFPILISLNIVIFVIYFKRQKKYFSKRGAALSFSGIFLGFFGVGCLSCGALVFAPLLSLLGLGGLVRYGEELSIFGLVFVLLSIIYLLRQITKPLVC